MSGRRRAFPRLTDSDVLDALERYHGPASTGSMEWAFAREVPVETGYADRRIDALAVNCWRSKRYRVRAYEVKVSRADFRKECDQPWKSEKARALAHEFVFAVPRGMVDLSELPDPACGLVEVDAIGNVRVRRQPRPSLPEAWSPTFIASIVRSAQRTKAYEKRDVEADARTRALADVLRHHLGRVDSPDPAAPLGEWRTWAAEIVGREDAWAALARLDPHDVHRNAPGVHRFARW